MFQSRVTFKIVRRRVTLKGRRSQYEQYREKAREVIIARVEHFSHVYGLSYNKIFIRNQKSRWGSCSQNKNLNFHYKLALLPAHLRDYVIVHEVCHLAEFNHSKNFWDLVSKTMPDCKAHRRELTRKMIGL